MNRKIVNTLVLFLIFLLISVVGIYFAFFKQKGIIKEKQKIILNLKTKMGDKETLLLTLHQLQDRAKILDSILALRKFNIPYGLQQTKFYDFVNKVSENFNEESFVNITFENSNKDGEFQYYLYTLTGTATFNDVYKLIYAIEESKELKKIRSIYLSNYVKVNDKGIAQYLISFNIQVAVYYAYNDFFATSLSKENNIYPNPIYDIFYPGIRNEIPPNIDGLLDVQTAQLLAIIPDGAFLTDSKGKTYLLWEGDEVYLGYVTKIDFDNNEVYFILNKGGIIERVKLSLATENDKKKSEKK